MIYYVNKWRKLIIATLLCLCTLIFGPLLSVNAKATTVDYYVDEIGLNVSLPIQNINIIWGQFEKQEKQLESQGYSLPDIKSFMEENHVYVYSINANEGYDVLISCEPTDIEFSELSDDEIEEIKEGLLENSELKNVDVTKSELQLLASGKFIEFRYRGEGYIKYQYVNCHRGYSTLISFESIKESVSTSAQKDITRIVSSIRYDSLVQPMSEQVDDVEGVALQKTNDEVEYKDTPVQDISEHVGDGNTSIFLGYVLLIIGVCLLICAIISILSKKRSIRSHDAKADEECCAYCGTPINPEYSFCLKCGEKIKNVDDMISPQTNVLATEETNCEIKKHTMDSDVPSLNEDVVQQMRYWKQMLDEGIISIEDYDRKKKEILGL